MNPVIKYWKKILYPIIIFLFIMNPYKVFAVNIEPEIAMGFRSYFGDVSSTTRFNFSGGCALQFSGPVFSSKNVGAFFAGVDFHYFNMKNKYAKMSFYQTGLIASYYFSNIFNSSKLKSLRALFPLLRFHGGYNRTEMNSNGGNNFFTGIGAGLGIKIVKELNLKTMYMFDIHFFNDGNVMMHMFTISLAYNFKTK